MMNQLLIYAIEGSICLAVLWVFYAVALKNDTNHLRNRIYLLTSLVFSAAVPLIDIAVNVSGRFLTAGSIASVLLPEIRVDPAGGTRGGSGAEGLLPLFYMAGLIISAGLIIPGYVGLLKMFLSGIRKGRVIYCNNDRPVCFSAFGYVFISQSIPDDCAARMIRHEMNHIRQLHHFDLLLAGIIEVLQWFNPAAYLMRRSLQAVHEYEADNECITHGEDTLSYQQLLVSYALGVHTPVLSNTFSKSSLLKNRIIMMTKKRTGNYASLKLIVALPLALILVFLFSCKDGSSSKKDAAAQLTEEKEAVGGDAVSADAPDDVFTAVEIMPVFRNDTTGGALLKWVGENIVYPEKAKKDGIQGKVIIKFIVDEAGNVNNPVVVRGVDPLLDEAALEVIRKCPQWSAGMQGGVPVKVYYHLPINFALN
jgi:TonB family protein